MNVPQNESELMVLIERHWREHCPGMVADLEQSGRLKESIRTAAQLTMTAMAQLVNQQQMDRTAAWQAVRHEWALLPAEEE